MRLQSALSRYFTCIEDISRVALFVFRLGFAQNLENATFPLEERFICKGGVAIDALKDLWMLGSQRAFVEQKRAPKLKIGLLVDSVLPRRLTN